MTEIILACVLAILLVATFLLLRNARRDPENWRIDLLRGRPTFNHYKELVLIAILGLFLAAGLVWLVSAIGLRGAWG